MLPFRPKFAALFFCLTLLVCVPARVLQAQSNSVDPSTLTGKFMMGYQGWHASQGDGSALNQYVHWTHAGNVAPSTNDTVDDIWPDLSEFTAGELFGCNLTLGNGQPAKIYSAYVAQTVARHCKWMSDYGVDGVFVQRFSKDVFQSAQWAALRNTNLVNVRAGAETYGRVFCVMYDISNEDPSQVISHLQSDWATLTGTLQITNSPRYLRHRGKPVVAIWGLGFSGVNIVPSDAQTIINYFKSAGCTVVGGVPYWWRTLNNDSQTNTAWTAVYHSFDVLSPWAVGRYTNTASANALTIPTLAADLADLNANGVDYMPVIFPGYTAHNLNGGALNEAPRFGGTFYWGQAYNAVAAGSPILYGAMFDEIDEGTATYKLAPTQQTTPQGVSMISLDVDGQSLPSDWYLRVATQIGRTVRGDIPLNTTLPITPTNSITLVSPGGGQIWTAGAQSNITWSSTGTINGVNIDISADGGVTWSHLLYNLANSGLHGIRVPYLSSTNCRLRVCEIDGSPADWSKTFTIQTNTTNADAHLEPLWVLAPGSRPYVNFGGANTPFQRSIGYNALSNQVYIISRTGATSGLTINVLDATTGADLYQLRTDGISAGSISLLMLRVAADGAIYAANMSTTSTTSPADYRLYRWADAGSNTVPTLVYAGEPANRSDSVRWGDTLDVRGAGTNTQVLIDSYNTYSVAVLTPASAAMASFINAPGLTDYYPTTKIGRSVQFGAGNTFWEKHYADRFEQTSFVLSNSPPGTGTIPVSNYNSLSVTLGAVGINVSRSLLAGVNFAANTNQPDALDLYSVSNMANPVLLGRVSFPTNQQPNVNYIADVVFGDDRVFAVDGNNGILGMAIVGPPSITNQPQGLTVSVGTNCVFTVGATGSPLLNFQWSKNGTNISGATTTTLPLMNVQLSDAAAYSVTVSDSSGTVTSSNAALNVIAPVNITGQPASQADNAGTTAMFAVTATGSSPAYQWQKNTINLSNAGNISGANSATLVVSNLTKADQGSYSVIVSNTLGGVPSSNAVLTVIDPFIAVPPANRAGPAGATVSFTVTAAGTTPFTYQWLKNGANLTDGGNVSGSGSATLTLTNIQTGDAGNYQVAVSNQFGAQTSAVATLTVQPPPTITQQPSSRTNNAGTAATFAVSASGTGTLAYQWQVNGVNLTDGVKVSGSLTPVLTLNEVTASDAQTYTVVVSNAAGATTSAPATLVVVYPSPDYYEPFNYAAGLDLGGQTNADLLTWADVATAIAGPFVTVQSNSLSVPGLMPSIGNSIVFGGLGKGARLSFPAVTSGTLYYSFAFQVPNTNALSAGGVFIAGFNNSIGTQTNQPSVVGTRVYIRSTNGGYNLGVSKSSSTTTDWVWDPRTFATNQVLFVVGSYTFNGATTNDDVSKMWIDPSATTFGAAAEPATTTQTTNGPDITSAQIASFVFLQRVTNEQTAAVADELRIGTTWANVTPSALPFVSEEPMSVTTSPGVNVGFVAGGAGPAPLFYQWQLNGANVGNATGFQLSLTNVGVAQAGNYTAVVSNAYGAATSAVAALTLTAPQPGSGLMVAGKTGNHYEVDAISNFTTTNWTILTNFLLPANPTTIPDPAAAGISERFYRTTLLP